MARGFPGSCSFFVQDLRTGAGAAWNARARFPAASTLKLAIAVELMRELRGVPAPGTRLGGLLWRMLVYSDDRSANELLEAIGGSTSGGSTRVNAMMRALGLADSDMYGGYIVEDSLLRRAIPLEIVSRPSFIGKATTAWDLARLERALHLAAGRPRSADLALPRRVHALRRALPPLSPRARAHARWPELRPRRRCDAPAQGGVDLEGQARHRSPVLARGSVRRHGADVERPRSRLGIRRARNPHRPSRGRSLPAVRRLVPPLLRENLVFRRFWTGQTISLMGDQVTLIALPLTAVLVLDANAAQMGYLVAAELMPKSALRIARRRLGRPARAAGARS